MVSILPAISIHKNCTVCVNYLQTHARVQKVLSEGGGGGLTLTTFF